MPLAILHTNESESKATFVFVLIENIYYFIKASVAINSLNLIV